MKKTETIDYLDKYFHYIINFLPNGLKQIVENNTFIAGGAIRAKLENTKVNDIDFYFTDEESANTFKSFVELFKLNNKQWGEYLNLLVITENAITFQLLDRLEIQFITKFYGSPEKIVKDFDFTNSMSYYLPKTKELIITKEATEAIEKKKLIFNKNSHTPITSLKRINKFKKLGYKISLFERFKVIIMTFLKSPLKEIIKTGLNPKYNSYYGNKK